MAVHKLGDETYKTLQFDKQIWQGVNTKDIGDILSDMYPLVERVTSLSENRDLSWFYGGVAIVGLGRVQIMYPYFEDNHSEEVFLLKNICFSTFPYIYLKAIPREGWHFKDWTSAPQTEYISNQENLVVFESDYPNITGFVATFEEDDASNVGV